MFLSPSHFSSIVHGMCRVRLSSIATFLLPVLFIYRVRCGVWDFWNDGVHVVTRNDVSETYQLSLSYMGLYVHMFIFVSL